MKTVVLAVLAIAMSSRIARADDQPAEDRDEGVAFSLTILPVIASTIAVVATASSAFDDHPTTASQMIAGGAIVGMAIGPSLGHWYAGETYSTGLVLRGAGIAAALGGVAIGRSGHDDPAVALVVAGSVAFYTGVIWDIATVGSAVREHNRQASTLSVAPLVGQTTGLALSGTY